MSVTNLPQAEADALLALPKQREEFEGVGLPCSWRKSLDSADFS